ncbi:MAG: CehA/McbA family metallohydrolase [Polyangiaceae bacterium]
MPLASHHRGIATILICALGLLSGMGFGAEVEPRSAHSAPPSKPVRQPHFTRTLDVTHFQKGNVHTHTTLSDGGSSPEQTIAWYRSHGYQFLALTDHNTLSKPSRYASLQEPGFVLISGEEITMTGKGRQVHVNALCTQTRIPGGSFGSAAAALSNAISQVRMQGGVAIVNHPNFDWALTAADVTDARDAPLLEIASGHPYVHSAGDATHPSHESLWDIALSSGADFMGVGVDDEHHIDVSSDPPATPGRAWIATFGDVTDPGSICAAMGAGDLYASTGVDLRRIAVRDRLYEVEAVQPHATVIFIGQGGEELARRPDGQGPAVYTLRGDEGYVRARAELADGKRAWTPAVRVAN